MRVDLATDDDGYSFFKKNDTYHGQHLLLEDSHLVNIIEIPVGLSFLRVEFFTGVEHSMQRILFVQQIEPMVTERLDWAVVNYPREDVQVPKIGTGRPGLDKGLGALRVLEDLHHPVYHFENFLSRRIGVPSKGSLAHHSLWSDLLMQIQAQKRVKYRVLDRCSLDNKRRGKERKKIANLFAGIEVVFVAW